jgi:hypothetical protein
MQCKKRFQGKVLAPGFAARRTAVLQNKGFPKTKWGLTVEDEQEEENQPQRN